MIDNFGIYNLFGRDNYEYYARISGRVLKVEENWIFAFKYPPENIVPSKFKCPYFNLVCNNTNTHTYFTANTTNCMPG